MYASESSRPPESAALWPRIEARLTYLQPKFPAEEVALAARHWNEVSQHFIEDLERTAVDPSGAVERRYIRHLFALFLTAQQRDVRAHDAMVRIARLPAEVLENVLGDITTEGLNRCLASTCGGDETAIRTLIEDEGASIWARYAGLSALVTRVLEGDAPAQALRDYLDTLGTAEETRLETDPGRDREFLTALASTVVDVGAAPMIGTLRRWFAKGLIDEEYIDRDFVDRHADDDFDTRVTEGIHDRYVRSAIDEMKSWAFEDLRRRIRPPHYDPQVNRYGEPAQEPLVREPKIGRNDPCPCGSGTKYKKCCGTS